MPGAMIIVTLIALVAAAACTGGGRGAGEPCDTDSDCAGALQCFEQHCVPRCLHHVDCGDGFTCEAGSCQRAEGLDGAPCESELVCAPGLTCRLNENLSSVKGTCRRNGTTGVPGEACNSDDECRAGACALGHCFELCVEETECQRGWTCAALPRVAPDGLDENGDFKACLPETGTLTYEIPLDDNVNSPELRVAVPSNAVGVEMVMTVNNPFHRIGATYLESPGGDLLYANPQLDRDFYDEPLRHVPAPGISVVKLPARPEHTFEAGAYKLRLAVSRDDGGLPSRERRLQVVLKLDLGAVLDLHFYIADLTDHPCAEQLGELATLGAAAAPTMAEFQEQYVEEIRNILSTALATGATTYEDLDVRSDLHGLDTDRAGDLFELNTHPRGVAVFLVRSISPAGVQVVVGGTPGSPLPGTRSSGVAISLDALCYRDWRMMARQTAHAIARHLGLFRNVEPDGIGFDPIDDSPSDTENLMHYNEFAGTALSPGQRKLLRLSPVVR